MKKGLIFLCSLLLLTACNTGTTEEGTDTGENPVNEGENGTGDNTDSGTDTDNDNQTETDEPDANDDETTDDSDTDEEEAHVSGDHVFKNLVDETTFTDEEGLKAWDDYQYVLSQTDINEYSLEPNSNGSTMDEVDAVFQSIEDRDNVEREEVEISENEKLVLYRYTVDENSEYSEVADFLAEVTYYYIDDQLMFSSVTPGFYTVDVTNLPSIDELVMYTDVAEVEALDSTIYTVSEMTIDGEPMTQTMVPAMATDEEGNEMMIAFYFMTRQEEIVLYGYLPFEQAGHDFPSYSIIVFQQTLSNYGGS